MTTLHIVNQSPFDGSSLAQCLRLAKKGDRLLLIENGVLALPAFSEFASQTQAKALELFALEPDLRARGILQHAVHCTDTVDYSGFVALTEQAAQVICWTR